MEHENLNTKETANSRSWLSYEEAVVLSMKTKWKLTFCISGEKCWCRIIEPETKIEDKDGNEMFIASSGCVLKEYAEHIVKLHNDSLSSFKH